MKSNSEFNSIKFEKCNGCDRIGIDCIPYLVSLSSDDLLEWCRIRKKQLRMTNEELAEKANSAMGTINRLFSSKRTDFMYSSMQPIVFALLGIDGDDISCTKPDTKELERKHKEEIERIRQEDKRMIDFLNKQLAQEQKQAISRQKTIRWLVVALIVLLVLIIVALLVDRLNPNIGFFWLKTLFAPDTGMQGNPGKL